MPRRLRATPRRGGNAMVPIDIICRGIEGYNREVPNHLRQLLDRRWKEGMLGIRPATQQTKARRRRYWTLKNLLAAMIMRLPGVADGQRSSSEQSSSISTSSSSYSQPMQAPSPQLHQVPSSAIQPPVQPPVDVKRKRVQRNDFPSPSSYVKCSGLKPKEASDFSKDDTTKGDNPRDAIIYAYPIIEEIPPEGPLKWPGKPS